MTKFVANPSSINISFKSLSSSGDIGSETVNFIASSSINFSGFSKITLENMSIYCDFSNKIPSAFSTSGNLLFSKIIINNVNISSGLS